MWKYSVWLCMRVRFGGGTSSKKRIILDEGAREIFFFPSVERGRVNVGCDEKQLHYSVSETRMASFQIDQISMNPPSSKILGTATRTLFFHGKAPPYTISTDSSPGEGRQTCSSEYNASTTTRAPRGPRGRKESPLRGRKDLTKFCSVVVRGASADVLQ